MEEDKLNKIRKDHFNMKRRRTILFLGMLCVGAGVFMGRISAHAWKVPDGYSVPEKVSQLAVVRYKGGSRGRFQFYIKNKQGIWKKKFACTAWLGRRGIGKKREGDQKTPTGLYSLDQAFGILRSPGTKMPYVKVNRQHYWCGDSGSGYYNRLIRKNETGHNCGGEHLIDYKGVYDYAVSIGYNKKGKPGKGSAIFLHCSRGRATAGCVAIPKKYMKKVLKKLDPASSPQILIYE